ncbi:YggT family protein [Alicyclobacillus sp. TC]|uniref:YggT family protein n=1 Tax=Alicyclobacillus sp. TC TaxID=2606450 RepID=UPI001932F879|nr:YggT family protein [Alicyclobacillus sp. TC]QRF23801.1 YggT family protein [Alicyclobacillus sp. TC]
MTLLVQMVHFLFSAYFIVLIASAVASWFPELQANRLVNILQQLSQPYYAPFQRLLRPIQVGGILLDWSSIVAVIVYFVIQSVIFSALSNMLGGLV